MKLKFASYTLAGILVTAALATLAPSAAAQVPTEAPATVEIKITPYDQPIKPLSGVAILTADVTYTYQSFGSPALTASQVSLKVAEQPPWATVAISPSTLFFEIGNAPAGTQVKVGPKKVSIIVATTADAPAFTPANVRITAAALANPPIGAAQSDDTTLITADFFSIIDAQATQPIRVVRPQTAIDIPVSISNFGNANSKISWKPSGEPGGGLQAPTPMPLTLQAQQTGGTQTKGTSTLSIVTPFKNGYMNQIGVLNMNLEAAYAQDTTLKGDEIPISVLITTKGFYVPAMGPIGFIVALGAAFMMAGRLKRD